MYVGAQPPAAVPWSAAGTGPQIQAQGSGVKDLDIQESWQKRKEQGSKREVGPERGGALRLWHSSALGGPI